MSPPRQRPSARFDDFQTLGDPELEKALAAAKEWAAAVQNCQPPRWITFLGNPGTGKTMLSKKLFAYALQFFSHVETEHIVRSVYWPKFIQKLRGQSAYAERDDMARWPVLLLDDIGAERDTTGFASDELNALCGCRMGKWTILTANLSHQEVGKIDARISSRMIRDQNICVEINTKDYALRAK